MEWMDKHRPNGMEDGPIKTMTLIVCNEEDYKKC